MEAFTSHTGIGVPLRRSNVDTDQIIPAVYLKRVTRTGFEDGLFAAWRGDETFVLNDPSFSAGSGGGAGRGAGPDAGPAAPPRPGREARVVEHERLVAPPGGEQAVLEAGTGDPLEVHGRDDLVGVDVAAAQRHTDPRVACEGLHQ